MTHVSQQNLHYSLELHYSYEIIQLQTLESFHVQIGYITPKLHTTHVQTKVHDIHS